MQGQVSVASRSIDYINDEELSGSFRQLSRGRGKRVAVPCFMRTEVLTTNIFDNN